MKICCMNLAIAVRIAGCLAFIASLIIIIACGFAIATIDQIETADKTGNEQNALIVMMIYSICYLISSALLIYASVVKNWAFTVPWLVIDVFGFVLEIARLIIDCVKNGAATEVTSVFITILSLIPSVYFWLCVWFALLEWKEESKDQRSPNPTSPGNCRVGFDNRQVVNYYQVENLPV